MQRLGWHVSIKLHHPDLSSWYNILFPGDVCDQPLGAYLYLVHEQPRCYKQMIGALGYDSALVKLYLAETTMLYNCYHESIFEADER